MTNTRQEPVVIEFEDEDLASPADAPPVPDAPAKGAAMQQAMFVASATSRPIFKWLWWALSALVSFVVSLSVYDYLSALQARNPLLGLIASLLVGLLLLVLLILALREIAAMLRLRRIDKLQQMTRATQASGDLSDARRAADAVTQFYAGRADLAWALADIEARKSEVMDAQDLLGYVEDSLMVPLDAQALREVEAASRQVATLTALVPLAMADVAAALASNLGMIRRISQIYGGRPGAFGNWRLTRSVFAHLVATGVVAIGDDLISSVAGGGVVAKLSRRFGEGVVNGALTARVGLAAMEVCRPMPFVRAARPPVHSIVSRALAGLFSGRSDVD